VFTIVLQVRGWLVFLAGTIVLGIWLRSNPAKRPAERASRVLHSLFWMGTYPPGLLGVFYPGLSGFDRELGLSSLPEQPVVYIVGAAGLLLGAYLIIVSNMALLAQEPNHGYDLKNVLPAALAALAHPTSSLLEALRHE
jgi:hypothetical protein